ncbi:outer membrane beta-barrel protein [Sphingomonas koreensis]
MKKIALAFVALSAAATPAFAQEETKDFNGPHVELLTGVDQVKFNTTGLEDPVGVLYGIGLGYDVQLGKVVVGIEGEAAESTAKAEANNIVAARASRDLYAGGRIGFVTGPTLIYLKAGYTNARVDTIAGNENGDGVRVGVGGDVRLKNNIFFRTEYRYSNYEAEVERHQFVVGVGMRF